MRRFAVRALILLLCLPVGLAAVAQAAPPDALRLQPGEQICPGHAAWPLGQRLQHGALVTVSSAENAADSASPGFRVEIAPRPGQQNAPTPQSMSGPRACLGLSSASRLDLYLTRAVEFRIKASAPVAGILIVTSSNTQDHAARDRSFGSFVIGTQWKTLRLPYGALAPLPGWAEESRRLGLRPGDNVLRPDSVEDLCIGVEAQRLSSSTPGGNPGGNAGEPVTLWIDSLRFVR